MKIKYILFLIFIFFYFGFISISAEEQVITNDGRKVILHNDGTWEYVKNNTNSSSFKFRKIEWGASKNTVKSIEKSKLIFDEKDKLIYEDYVLTFETWIFYSFVNDKLVQGNYIFRNRHSNQTDFIADYKNTKEKLIKKYGQPSEDEFFWKDDLYKDSPNDWGIAVSKGDLFYYAIWELETTQIGISLSGDNYEVKHIIEYHSKKFKDIKESVRNKEDLEEI